MLDPSLIKWCNGNYYVVIKYVGVFQHDKYFNYAEEYPLIGVTDIDVVGHIIHFSRNNYLTVYDTKSRRTVNIVELGSNILSIYFPIHNKILICHETGKETYNINTEQLTDKIDLNICYVNFTSSNKYLWISSKFLRVSDFDGYHLYKFYGYHIEFMESLQYIPPIPKF